MRPEAPRALGLTASAAASVAWGTAAVFVELARLPALVILFYRLWLAAVLLVLASVVMRRPIHRRDLAAAVPGGLLLCVDMATFFSALKLTSVADAAVIGALQPALVLMVAGRLFKEEVARSDIALTAVAVAGVVAVVAGPGPAGPHAIAGDLVAVVSLVAWTGYFLASKRARAVVGAFEYTVGVTLVAALVLTPVVLVSGVSLGVSAPADWTWIVLLALVPGAGHLLMNWAQGVLDVSMSSLVGATNPLFAAGAGWLVLHQSLSPVQIAGGLLGVAAVCGVAARRRIAAMAPVEPAT